jgi:DNA repair protein RecN (Recombination protein N)
MLLELNIENFIIIDRINVSFHPGLNILTGETGAGKSIIVEAINLALGQKMKNTIDVVRSNKAIIELIFDVDEKTLRDLNPMISSDSQGLFVVSREIFANGKSISRLNGKVITLAQLRLLTSQLIDIHGQHMHQALLDTSTHLITLDRYAEKTIFEAKKAVEVSWASYNDISKKLQSLLDKTMTDDTDYLRFQIEEIKKANLNLDSDHQVLDNFSKYANIEEYLSALEAVLSIYSASNGLNQMIVDLKRTLSTVTKFDQNLEMSLERIKSIQIELEDVMDELSIAKGDADFNPEDFKRMEQRVDLLNTLMKKYGPTLADVAITLDDLESTLQRIESRETMIESMKAEITKAYNDYVKSAKELSRLRRIASESFDKAMIDEIKMMNMPDVVFKTAFTEKKAGEGYKISKNGIDTINFMISTNKGIEPMDLSRIASGGEISRVMLGIKSALSRTDSIPTMIFDEIDSGISGETAFLVGKKMARLTNDKQIIAITHLPQISAAADRHFKIEKLEGQSNLIPLNPDECVLEIARLLSGQHIDQTAIANSRNLLDHAAMFRKDTT